MADSPRHVAIIMDGNGRWARSRGPANLDAAFQSFAQRERRFGKTSAQITAKANA